MGGLALAEQEYLDMIAKLRVAQGANSDNIALMLDHLGEFYLEARSFDKAYKAFSDALEVRKGRLWRCRPQQRQRRQGRSSLRITPFDCTWAISRHGWARWIWQRGI